MAVAFDSSAARSATSTAAVALTLTVANSPERALFAIVTSSKASSVSAITYAGTSLSAVTAIEFTDGVNLQRMQIYVQAAPAVGTGTCLVAMSGANSFGVALACFNGVDQVTHYRTLKTSSGSGVGVTMVGSSSNIDVVFAGIAINGSAGAASITAGLAVELWSVIPARTHTFEGHRDVGAASTATIVYSFQSTVAFTGFMLSVKGSAAAAGGGPGPNMFTQALTGCGLKWIIEDLLPLPPFEVE